MDKKKILIIDDEEAMCFLVKLNLERSGEYEVFTAASGGDGLIKIKERRFDLVITDLLMPGIGGKEILRAAKAMYPDMPVLLCSAYYDSSGEKGESDTEAADGYIKKPFDCEEINNTVRNIIAAKK